MSAYLVAFIISEFQHRSNGNFGVWGRDDMIEYADYSLEVAPKIIDFYANYFNISYPLPKMDLVAVPDFWPGAMENWGLITYK